MLLAITTAAGVFVDIELAILIAATSSHEILRPAIVRARRWNERSVRDSATIAEQGKRASI